MAILNRCCVMLAGLYVVFAARHVSAQPVSGWVPANPVPTSDLITTMTWDGARFVGMAGFEASILTSTNGTDWSYVAENFDSPMRSLVFTGDQYVAVGEYSTIATSPDAVSWTVQAVPIPLFYRLSQVAWSPARHQLVAVGEGGLILTSANGSNWILRGSGTVDDLTAVVWGNAQYVAIGSGGVVLTSPDGINWSDATPSSGPIDASTAFTAIAWNGSVFAATAYIADPTANHVSLGGEIFVTADPTDTHAWQRNFLDPTPPDDPDLPPSPDVLMNRIIWNGTNFVAARVPGRIVTSADAQTWTSQNLGSDEGVLSLAASSDVVVVTTDNSASFLTSTAAADDWTLRSHSVTQFVDENFSSVTWTGEQFAATTDTGSFYTSSGGLAWTPFYSVFPMTPAGVAWGINQFVAVGDSGIYTSPDGAAWTAQDVVHVGDVQFAGVAWGNDLFVAVGSTQGALGSESRIFSSADGAHWTMAADAAVPGDAIRSVVWNGAQFVAVGSAHANFGSYNPTPIYVSPNGLDWARHTIDGTPGKNFASIAWGGGRYVAVGTEDPRLDPRAIATSSDGVHWNYIAPPFALNADALTSVAWTGNRFVAVGGEGIVLSSRDGITWSNDVSGTDTFFTAISANGLRCVAVGFNSSIMRNDSQCNADAVFNNGFESPAGGIH